MSITTVYLDPANGAPIAKDYPISFSVRTQAAAPFVRVVVCIHYPAIGITELAYAQDPAGGGAQVFENQYGQGGSKVTVITDPGFLHYGFVVYREPFWPASPELLVYAFNTAGQELP